MKQIKYHGPHPQVEVEVAPKRWQVVDRGAVFEVADNMAASLLDQPDNWKLVKAKKSTDKES